MCVYMKVPAFEGSRTFMCCCVRWLDMAVLKEVLPCRLKYLPLLKKDSKKENHTEKGEQLDKKQETLPFFPDNNRESDR